MVDLTSSMHLLSFSFLPWGVNFHVLELIVPYTNCCFFVFYRLEREQVRETWDR